MMQVHAFDATGRYLAAVPASRISVSESIGDIGGMTVTIPDSRTLRRLDLPSLLREYGSIWAVMDGGRPRHAGWLTGVRMADDGTSMDLTVGSGWTLFQRRLVIPKALADKWSDGYVVIDEEHPPGDWVLSLAGTYSDICRGLVAEALKFGSADLYRLPGVQGGTAHVRNYNAWELAYTADRLQDVGQLDDGPEIRFDPLLDGDDIMWTLTVGDPEIIDHTWRLNLRTPGQRIRLLGVDIAGANMANQAYGVGGRTDDRLLVARTVGSTMTAKGWPPLQVADTSHSTVSDTNTLKGYTGADVATGDQPQYTIGLECGLDRDMHVGDWIDLRVPDDWPDANAPTLQSALLSKTLGDVWALKVTDVDWDTSLAMQSLQCKVRWQ